MEYKFKTKPYAHQLSALKKSWNKKRVRILYGDGYR